MNDHHELMLVDHAHCEKKAASTAISLLFRYADIPAVQLPLSELAREEMEHFELMIGLLRERGWEFRRLHPAPYAGELLKKVRTYEPVRLADTFLCCALIEARSCERMQLLAETIDDRKIAAVYEDLLASEARHHTMYVDLARQLGGLSEVELKARLLELAAHEYEILAAAPFAPRVHSGWADL